MSAVPSDCPFPSDEVVASGNHEGIPWITAKSPYPNAVNGYVRLPADHPWLADPENTENTVPWGSITYARGNWIGFDTLHSGQHWPGSRMKRFPGERTMTRELVAAWAELLAIEAKEAAA